MKLRVILTTIFLLPIAYILVKLFAAGTSGLSDDFILPAYVILMVLTLPSLISKFALGRGYFGTGTVVSFLIYPALYLVSVIGGHLVGTSTMWIVLLGILAIVAWNILLVYGVWSLELGELRKLAFMVAIGAACGGAYSAFLILSLRSTDSVLALDYLQHNAVVSSMQAGKLCLLPGACSNLFLQQGYTTLYHSILNVITAISGGNFPRTVFMMDFVFATIMGGLVYKIMLQATHRRSWAFLGSVLTLLVFTNGAYDYSFFLPQTLAFMLFLNLLGTKHSMKSLMVGITVLVLSHFIIGSFLAVLLIVKVLLIDDFIADERKDMPNWALVIVTVMIPVFSIILNIAGFSVERNLQEADVKTVGSLTNLYSPENIQFVVGILGVGTIILAIATIYWLIQKHKSNWIWFALITLSINISVYFLGPTYANKFLMGASLVSAILIVQFLARLKFTRMLQIVVSGILIVAFAANFYIQYHQYEHFYLQNTGEANAIVPEDKALIDFLRASSESCLVLSDPYTQIIITGLTGRETANAQYMIPESRKLIEAFNEKPSDETYKALLTMKEIKGKTNVCYLYTSRMEESVKTGYRYWTESIYSYIVDDNYPILKVPTAVNYLANSHGDVIFRNPNFYLVKLSLPATFASDSK